MTWEQKLLDILGVNKEFDGDNKIGSFIDISPMEFSNQIELLIKAGNAAEVEKAVESFKSLIQKWKSLLNHLRKSPSCVKYNSHSNNYCWKDGYFALGYYEYPKGLQEIADKMLYFSRLIRDAESRVAKHQRFRQV